MLRMAPITRFHPVDVHVGRRIRQRRLELDLTQGALADRLGVAQQMVARYETASVRVSASRLWLLAQALGVEIGWFFEGMPRRNNRNHHRGGK